MKPGVLIDKDVPLAGISLGNIVARIERLPANAMHVRARLLIGLATFFDGFDVIVIATTLPLLIAKWALTPAQIAFVIAARCPGSSAGASSASNSACTTPAVSRIASTSACAAGSLASSASKAVLSSVLISPSA